MPQRPKYGPYAKTRERAITDQPNPSGLCWCDCGEKTPLAKSTSKRDNTLLGYPVRWIQHHRLRPKTPQYIVEDCGYKTPCWIWQWHRDHMGYGKISRDGKSQPAHRWFYEQAKGPIPEGLDLDHLCFQPPCVNPDHNEPVTPRINNERRRSMKLSRERARAIRDLDAQGMRRTDIARLYEISTHTVWSVCVGNSWVDRVDSTP